MRQALNTDSRGLMPMRPYGLDRAPGGAGGGKAGKGSSGAHEANDTLRSKADARIVDLLSEGEIEGIVGLPQLQGVYANGTPIQNPDGTYNFKDALFYFAPGTQDQSYFPAFSAAESESSINVQFKTATPWTQHLTSTVLNAVRVTITLPALSTQSNTNGDINGSQVSFKFQLQTNGAGYVDVLSETINGKCSSAYQRSYRIELSGIGPWDIRAVRLTADSASSFLHNDTYIASFATIIDGKFRYPNSAIAGIVIDSEQFPSIPARAYDTKGIKVRVPTNYDPVSRLYTGLWDGTFTTKYTNNPAWCWYDMALNVRYGIGGLLKSTDIDKWALYAIGQYCDGLVSNGSAIRAAITSAAFTGTAVGAIVGTATFKTWSIIRSSGSFVTDGFAVGDQIQCTGWTNANNNNPMVIRTVAATTLTFGSDFEAGRYYSVNANLINETTGGIVMSTIAPVEPRFTCNLYLQSQEEALKVLSDMAGTFRGMVYYGAGLIVPVQDSPQSPIFTFTKANVVDGRFAFAGVAGRARHTSAIIAWNDPTDLGRKKYAYVEDSDAVLQFGFNQIQSDGFGVSSYGQAVRYGRWALLTEQSSVGITPETVSFKVGLEGMVVVPGSIIQTSVPWRAGKDLAGRISALGNGLDLGDRYFDHLSNPYSVDLPPVDFAGTSQVVAAPLTTEF